MNPIEFTAPLANSVDYPKPLFLALPSSPGQGVIETRAAPIGVGQTLMSTHARYALALIARAELKPGALVLLPAYHCPALVEPFVWAGCRVEFYPMSLDLSPDNHFLASKLVAAQAIVLVRFFGFDANIKESVAKAKQTGCLVIEDLAHAAFAEELHGDYGVTSLKKFYPVDDGAEIYVHQGRDITALKRAIAEHQKSSWQWYMEYMASKLLRKIGTKLKLSLYNSSPFRYFYPEDFGNAVAHFRKTESCFQPGAGLIESRRRNYLAIQEKLENSTIGSPLFPLLEDNTAPYVFPFLLSDSRYFDPIRSAGIPLFRWEELALSGCDTSAQFRSRLIQIPCHQELSGSNLESIAQAFERARTIVEKSHGYS